MPSTMMSEPTKGQAELSIINKCAVTNSNVEQVGMPESQCFIANEAFVNCTSLREIVIPGRFFSISATVFIGCSEDLILYGYAGDGVEASAEALGCYFESMGE